MIYEKFIEKCFDTKCKYRDVCSFYDQQSNICNKTGGEHCGIKKEIDSGQTWEWIKFNHHKMK